MKFEVIGLDAGSTTAERRVVVEAADAATARLAASALGVAALAVRAVSGAQPMAKRGGAAFDVDLFCIELLALLRAGVSLREALETLRDKRARGDTVVLALLSQIHEGKPLSAALQAQPSVFPPLLVESVRSAERTSDLEPALERYARYRQQTRELRGKLAAAALYPLILLGVSVAVLLFLVGYIIPRFAQIYADLGDRLPAASRLLLQLGLFLQQHPAMLAMAAAALAAALVWAVRQGHAQRAAGALLRAVPRLHEALGTVQCARLYRTLAMLLAGGVPLPQALGLARGVLPPEMRARADDALQRIAQGQAVSESFSRSGLSTVVGDRFFRVGERSGRLADMMDRAADFHEDEIARTVDWIGRVIGPVMMLVMGGLIGAVVVLMYLPIFQLTEALQ
jgi:general secretion pathway protein F